ISLPGAIKFSISTDGKITVTQNLNYTDAGATKAAVVAADGLNLSLTNLKIAGHVQLTKQDTSTPKTGIEGVAFDLYKDVAGSDADILMATGLTTGTNGVWTSIGSADLRVDAGNTTKSLGDGLEEGSYYFKETKTKDQYYNDATKKYAFTITAADDYATNNQQIVDKNKLTVSNADFIAYLDLTKLDAANGDAIADTFGTNADAGAHFTLIKTSAYDGSKTTTYDLRTNAQGKAYVYAVDGVETNAAETPVVLAKGTYTLAETQSPLGYEAKNNNSFEAAFTVTDAEYGKTLTVNKDSVSTDADKKDFDLRVDQADVDAFLSSKQETVAYEGLYNERKLTSVQLMKQDADSNAALNNAEFKVEKESTPTNFIEWLQQLLTGKKYDVVAETLTAEDNAKGLLTLDNLDYGTYKITETKAPNGYELENGDGKVPSITVTIDRANAGTTITLAYDNDGIITTPEDAYVTNKQTSLTIDKTVYGTTTKLAGAEMKLSGTFADGSTTPITWTTDGANAKVLTGQLVVGNTYTLEETNRVTGYESLVGKTVTFHLDKQGRLVIDTNQKMSNAADAAAGAGTNTLTLSNLKVLGKAKLTKTGAAGALAGVTFDVYAEGGTKPVQAGLVTDAAGIVTTQDLPEGKYYFVETGTLDNYVLDETHVTFEIGAADYGKVIEVTMTNELLVYNVTLTKKDAASDTGLAETEFTLYQEDAAAADGWTKVEAKKTAENGTLSFTIGKKGTYKVTETAAATGYKYDAATAYSRTFTVDNTPAYQNQTLELGDIANTRIPGTVKLTKVDAADKAIAGTIFTLFTKDGTKVKDATTGADGVAAFTDIPWGAYYVQETKETEGYKLSDKKYDVTIGSTSLSVDLGKIANVVFEAYLDLTKLDAANGDAIVDTFGTNADAGAHFTMVHTSAYDGSKTIYDLRTNAQGKAYVYAVDGVETNAAETPVVLAKGTYTLEETQSPLGYEAKNNNSFEAAFTVTDAEYGKTLAVDKDSVSTDADKKDFDLRVDQADVDAFLSSKQETPASQGLYNERKATKVNLLKVDADDKHTELNNAVFKLEQEKTPANFIEWLQQLLTGKKYDVMKENLTPDTNADGLLTLENLDYGTYRITEIVAPNGYELENAGGKAPSITFTIDRANAGTDITLAYDNDGLSTTTEDEFVTNKQTSLTIDKVVYGTTTKLAGAEMKLSGTFADGSTAPITWKTDGTNAKVLTGQLVVGNTYTLEETNRVTGYESLVGKTVTFHLDKQGRLVIDTNQKMSNAADAAAGAGTNTLTLSNLKVLGKAKLTKTGAAGALAGVTFDVYAEGGTKPVQAGLVTDAAGIVTTQDLPEGKYYFVETGTLDNYVLDGTHVAFEIGANDYAAVKNVTMTNAPLVYNVHLTKKDAADKATLAGVEFTLYEKDGTEWKKAEAKESNENGEITFTLNHKGSYKVVETKTLQGYELDAKAAFTKEFTVDNTAEYQNKTLEIGDVENVRTLGKVNLTKVDAADQKAIAGAIFTLFAEDGKKVKDVATGADGVAAFTDISWGKYYVQETKAADGYQLDDTKYDVTIGSDLLVVELGAITNDRSDLSFIKRGYLYEACADKTLAGAPDPLQTELVSGVEFTIYNDAECKNEVAKATSDAKGVVSFKQLLNGTYYVRETKASGKYVLDNTVYVATINDNGEFTGLKDLDGNAVEDNTLYNDVPRTDIEIEKVSKDDSNKKLPGSTYGLFRRADAVESVDEETQLRASQGITAFANVADALLSKIDDGDILIAMAVTDENGLLKFEGVLTGVEYKVKELIAPAGSQVSERPMTITFKVDDNGAVVIEKVDDGGGTVSVDETTGEIIWHEPQIKVGFSKVDENNQMLAGAVLQVTDKDGKVIDKWTSTKDVYVIAGKLFAGEKYTLTELSAPSGYEIAAPVTFTVEARDVGPDEDYIQAVSMVDKKSKVEVITPTPTVTPKPSPIPTRAPLKTTLAKPITTTKKAATKTGDESNAMLWIAMMLFAGSGAVVVTRRKKKVK
ncbi:MAG: SpaA isopeptide-forming pilin-related protein, partial [Lachnospiraceae bacterium]|nr:SpaA isopeptide-forming pilin-related protein [Lachnospiraceae bacterium]